MGADSRSRVWVQRVTRRFPGVIANDAVSLEVRAGEVHVLLGENGAGKSTLIALLAGLLRPDSGTLYVDGQAMDLPTPKASIAAGIGTVFQHSMLVPRLSVADNLLLDGRWWQRPDRRGLTQRVKRISDAFGIDLPLAACAGELSLGEQQTVEIVRALLRRSRVLLLDEATSMLDPTGVEELGRLMRGLAASGLAVVFVTHKLDEACAFGDRISVLKHGRNAGEFGPDRLRRRHREELEPALIACMFDRLLPAGVSRGHRQRSLPVNPPVLLDVRGLHLPPNTTRPGLHAIDCQLHAGEILGIAGIDGNGQAELAQVLAGQRAPSSGEIRFVGARIEALGVSDRRRLGIRYVTDDRLGEGTVASLPVGTNFFLKDIGQRPLWRWGIERRRAIDRAAQARVKDFDVRTPDIRTPLGHLSGGNVQKVILGRELTDGARIVIFHKPTYGLDVQTSEAIRDRIVHSAAAGVGVLIISTDLDELIALCHRILVMVQGCIVGSVINTGDSVYRDIGRLMSGRGG